MDEKRELELINAFLDQELTPEEMSLFAEGISCDPALKDELKSLLMVKTLAKQIPEAKPPRSYVLSSKTAQQTRKPGILERLFPVFRWAGAFCCLFLICSFLLPLPDLKNTVRETPVQKSVSFEEINMEEEAAVNSIQPYSDVQVILDGSDRRSARVQGKAIAMPSFGNYGGSPQNAYQMRGESPEHRMEPKPETQNGTEMWLQISRVICSSLITVSAVWIALTLIKRNQLKIK